MVQQNNKIWYYMAAMMLIPFVIPMFLDYPYSMFAMMGSSLLMLVGIRRFMGSAAQNMLGSKMTWICSVCQKPHNKTTCPRCGSKQRRLS